MRSMEPTKEHVDDGVIIVGAQQFQDGSAALLGDFVQLREAALGLRIGLEIQLEMRNPLDVPGETRVLIVRAKIRVDSRIP